MVVIAVATVTVLTEVVMVIWITTAITMVIEIRK
jgi:hypothetical protein